MNARLVNLDFLPSKGHTYPKDIEIYVKPITMKEEISMARYGLTKAEYYENILDNINIRGCFDKNNLLYGDIQLIDLIRRLYTFDEDEKINIKDQYCSFCKASANPTFLLRDIEFTDFKEDVFNKEFTFSDGLQVEISPLTVRSFINICREYLSNIVIEEGQENTIDVSDFVLAYYANLVVNVKDRTFENDSTMRNYVLDYFKNLVKNKDKKILNQIDLDTATIAIPFKYTCEKCKKELEVSVNATMRFQ